MLIKEKLLQINKAFHHFHFGVLSFSLRKQREKRERNGEIDRVRKSTHSRREQDGEE